MKMQFVKRLIGLAQIIIEQKRLALFTRENTGIQKKSILSLFPVVTYTNNTCYSPRFDCLCITIRAADLKEWMDLN